MTDPVKNYAECCRKRMHLWVCEEIEVSRSDSDTLEIRWKDFLATLSFSRRDCSWILAHNDDRTCGTFDRLTKQLRRLLTSSPPKQEA